MFAVFAWGALLGFLEGVAIWMIEEARLRRVP